VSRRGLALALTVLALETAVAVWLVLTSDHEDNPWATVALALTAGVTFVVSGLVALFRRPENRTGAYLAAVGYLWFLGALTESNNTWVFTIGFVLGSLAFAPFAALVLAYPTGRLGGRLERAIPIAVVVFTTTIPLATLLVDPTPIPSGCDGCPESAIVISDQPALSNALTALGFVVAMTLLVTVVVLLVRRWRSASPALRRLLWPVLASAAATLVILGVVEVAGRIDDGVASAIEPLFFIGFGSVPIAFLLGILRTRFARWSVARLLLELGEGRPLRDSLARALGDPTLSVAYWVEPRQEWVDAEGRALPDPVEQGPRIATVVERDGRRVAALIHDASLAEQPELVDAVAAAAALALDNERLTAELRAQYQVLITAVNTTPSLLCVLDAEGRINNFNRAVETATGFDDAEVIRGRHFWDVFIDSSEREDVIARFRADAPHHPPAEYENRFVNARGDEVVIAWSAAPLHDESGGVVGIVAGGLDVTEGHRHAAELEREREFLNAIANNAPSLLCLIDETGQVADRATNVAFERLLEYDPAETGGAVFWERYIAPNEADEVRQIVEHVVAGGQPEEHDHHWISRTGQRLLVAWSCTPLPRIDERTLFLISGGDITERERRERDLRSSEERLRAAIESSPVAIVEFDPVGTVVGWNPAAERIYGWAPEEVIGHPVPFVPEDLKDEFEELFGRGRAGEVIAGHETVRRRKDGRRIDVSISAAPIRDSAGNVISYMGLYVDITERKRREVELQESHEMIETVAQAIPSLLVVVDTEARIVENGINRAFSETFGLSAEEAQGLSFLDLVDPGDDYAVRMAIAAAANGVPRTDLEARWLRQDGESRIVAWTATPLLTPLAALRSLALPEQPLVLITGVDITERKRQEEEIRASRSRILEAQSDERRRLERNLHDGAQQRLVSLAVSLRLAESRLQDDPSAVAEILTRAREELALALEELRELARGIHPAVLTDRGLGAALAATAARVPLPVELEVPEARLSPAIETAAYYVVSEALANVSKYSGASVARVSIRRDDGAILVEVADDGVGGADPALGTGLRGLADRIEALDGKLDVLSPAGEGTRIRAEIPLPAERLEVDS
jgi:PAS domain S-box-containing protein